eukprot:CCRYP_017847-RA/>CCRYP_017847-RA protein AED:0.37 eAED:0.61 QI:0/0/0/1/0/0/3/0/113
MITSQSILVGFYSLLYHIAFCWNIEMISMTLPYFADPKNWDIWALTFVPIGLLKLHLEPKSFMLFCPTGIDADPANGTTALDILYIDAETCCNNVLGWVNSDFWVSRGTDGDD